MRDSPAEEQSEARNETSSDEGTRTRVRSADLWRAGRLLGFRALLRRLGRRTYEYDILAHSAELAYYFLLSVFPMLLFLATLLGYLATEEGQLRSQLFSWISRISPSAEVTSLLHDTLTQIIEGRSGGKLSFGLVASLWLASNGVAAIGRSLNTAYHLKETRHWLIQRLWAVVLVIFASVLVSVSLLLILFGEWLNDYLVHQDILGVFLAELLGVIQWLVVLVLVIFAFEVIYNFAPAVWQRRHLWLTPGGLGGVTLWLAASLGLRQYLQWGDGSGGGYTLFYGPLGAVISLLLWFYLTAAAILVGGVVNGETLRALEEEAGEPLDLGAPEGEDEDEPTSEGSPETPGKVSAAARTNVESARS